MNQPPVSELDLADYYMKLIDDDANGTERSQQSAAFRLGVSDLGHCKEKVRRKILREDPTNWTHMLHAWVGTQLGDRIEHLIEQPNSVEELATITGAPIDQILTQVEIVVDLKSQDTGKTYSILGHADVIIPALNLVIDNKTKAGMARVSTEGPNQSNQFQRNLYAHGAIQMGLLDPDRPVWVANVYIDRSGSDPKPYVNIEPYSTDVIFHATQWLDDVVYAVRHDQEAERGPAYEFCRTYCELFTACRGTEVFTEGKVITDPDVKAAIRSYLDAQEMEKKGKALKAEARNLLKDVTGVVQDVEGLTQPVAISQTVVNREGAAAHSKLNIRFIQPPSPARKTMQQLLEEGLI